MPSDNSLFAYVNHQLEPYHLANLHISDLSVQRGYGIFDFLKMSGTKGLFLKDYLDRFYRSAELMELQVPVTRDKLKAKITELADLNKLEQSGIKMILTGGYSANGYDPGDPNLIIIQQPLTLPTPEMVSKGIKIITYEHARELALAKTINYTTGIRLIKKIREKGADDVLYYADGKLLEFPRCNLFVVTQDNTIVTPDKNVLQGITRKNVLQLASQKYKAEARTVTLEDLARAKEVFLTSTTKRILPIVQVDDLVIGDGKPGEVTMELLRDLIALEEAYLKAVT